MTIFWSCCFKNIRSWICPAEAEDNAESAGFRSQRAFFLLQMQKENCCPRYSLHREFVWPVSIGIVRRLLKENCCMSKGICRSWEWKSCIWLVIMRKAVYLLLISARQLSFLYCWKYRQEMSCWKKAFSIRSDGMVVM